MKYFQQNFYEIFPLSFFRNISAQTFEIIQILFFYFFLSLFFFDWFKKFHKNIIRGVLHKEGESYTHVDG